jgi:hypothetical protein
VDEHSHHDHKKRDLQVSKRGGLIHAKGEWSKAMREAKGLNQGSGTLKCIYARVFILYMLSANNIDLCLGYK